MPRWVSARWAAGRRTSSGAARLSKLYLVWQWRSMKAFVTIGTRPVGAAETASAHTTPVPPRHVPWPYLDRLDQALLEKVEVLEREPGAQRDAIERVLRNVAGHSGDLGQELVDVAEERPAARHDHALVDDVRRQFRRCLFEDTANCGDELLERSLDRFHDLRARDRDRAREAGDEVSAADLHLQLAVERQGGTDLDLDLLRRSVADHQVVLLADVGRDRLIELVAADPERSRHDDPAEGNDGDLTRPAADVDDHVAGRSADRDVGPDRGRERFLDEEGLLGPGLERGVANGPLLDARDAGRDADHHLGPADPDPPLRRLADEELEHRFGDDVVGNDAVLHRPDCGDVVRRAADHLAGLVADRDD